MKVLSLLVVILCQGNTALAADGMENVPVAPKTTPTPMSINTAAIDSIKSNRKGQVQNLIVGGLHMAQGYAAAVKCPKSGYHCAIAAGHFLMGALNFKQEKAMGVAASQAIDTYKATDTSGGQLGPDGGAGYDPSAVAKSEELKKAKAFMQEMSGTQLGAGKPFVYDPKTETLTTASGKKFKPEDMASPSSMAAAGIPKSMIDSFVASQKALNAEASKKAEAFKTASNILGEEGGGGGGGWGTSGSSADGSDAAGAGYAGAGASAGAGLGIDRDPAQLAGMQKNYNGEAIGVAGDSIFGMMTRRYKVKESQRSFYDEAELLVHK